MVIFSCVVKESKRQKRERFFFPKGKERKGKERKERVMAFFLFLFVCRTFFPSFFFVLFVSKATHEDEREREKKKEIVRS